MLPNLDGFVTYDMKLLIWETYTPAKSTTLQSRYLMEHVNTTVRSVKIVRSLKALLQQAGGFSWDFLAPLELYQSFNRSLLADRLTRNRQLQLALVLVGFAVVLCSTFLHVECDRGCCRSPGNGCLQRCRRTIFARPIVIFFRLEDVHHNPKMVTHTHFLFRSSFSLSILDLPPEFLDG